MLMDCFEGNSSAKKRIIVAVVELIQDTDISKITVSNIQKQANVSRSTFYRYFVDVYGVYETAISEFVEKCADLFKVILFTNELSLTDIETPGENDGFFPEAFSFSTADTLLFRYLQKKEPLLFSDLIKEKLTLDLPEVSEFVSSFILDSLTTIYTLDYFDGRSFNLELINLASGIIKNRSLL